MKKAIVLALALLVAGTGAYANDSNSRAGGGGYGPFGDGYANLRDESDVLIYQCREANDGFGDLIPYYEAALTAGGATVTAIDAPSGGGALPDPFPLPCDLPTVVVLTSENWWGPGFPPGDEAIIQAYLEAGGSLYLSGQDYLYGAGYPDGPQSGFPYFIGLDSVTQDTPFGADFMDVIGHDMFEGYYLFLDSYLIFLSNPFYPDTFVPRGDGGAGLWEQISPETHIGGLIFDAGGYRTIYTSIELAGDALGEFPGVMIMSWEWLKANAPVATEMTTVGAVKASYK
jgi:hypothetical protein